MNETPATVSLPVTAVRSARQRQMRVYRRFGAAWSVGKWPRALTARRYLALRDSMALVTGMKMSGVAGPLAVCLWRGDLVRHTVRLSGQGRRGEAGWAGRCCTMG